MASIRRAHDRIALDPGGAQGTAQQQGQQQHDEQQAYRPGLDPEAHELVVRPFQQRATV